MLRAASETDLLRLRHFLRRLENDARQTGGGDLQSSGREIARLKEEISYLEAFRSKAFLLQIPIDYGARR